MKDRVKIKNRSVELNSKYRVRIIESKEGFSVSVPGLPGCFSEGDTEKEALKNICIAIREYLAVANKMPRRRRGREVEALV